MAYLHIYFNDALRSVVELQNGETTIGRASDNDVVIDNPGVSAHHARILGKGEQYVIEDLASKNGVFVNGKRIEREPLRFGDAMVIFKHTLKFSAIGQYKAPTDSVSQDTHAVAQDATVMVNVSNLSELLKERQPDKAYLLQLNGSTGSHRIDLSKISFSIGKSPQADLTVKGWFAPRLAAKIVRRSDGYYLSAEKRGRVRLNGSSISKAAKLHNGDVFVVRGTTLKFFNRPPS